MSMTAWLLVLVIGLAVVSAGALAWTVRVWISQMTGKKMLAWGTLSAVSDNL